MLTSSSFRFAISFVTSTLSISFSSSFEKNCEERNSSTVTSCGVLNTLFKSSFSDGSCKKNVFLYSSNRLVGVVFYPTLFFMIFTIAPSDMNNKLSFYNFNGNVKGLKQR